MNRIFSRLAQLAQMNPIKSDVKRSTTACKATCKLCTQETKTLHVLKHLNRVHRFLSAMLVDFFKKCFAFTNSNSMRLAECRQRNIPVYAVTLYTRVTKR